MRIRPKTKRRLILLAAAVLLMGAIVGSWLAIHSRMTATKMAAAREKGMTAYKAGYYSSAVSQLSYYLDRSQTTEKGENADFEALFAYGRSLQLQPPPSKGSRTENLTQAMNLFERYLRLRADDPPAQHALLELYLKLNYVKEALRTSDEVLARHPDDVEAIKGKLIALQRQATTPPAELQAAAKRLTEVAPHDLWGRRQTITLRLDAGVPASKLIAEAEELRSANPQDPWYDLLVATTYHVLSQASPERSKADATQRDAWNKVVRERLTTCAARPTQGVDYVRQLVWFLDQYQMFPQSLAVLQKAVDDKPREPGSDAPIVRELSQRLWEASRYQEVADQLSKLDPKSPTSDVRTVVWRALALRELGEPQKQQAADIARDLGERAGDPAAVAWSAALQAHFASPPREPRERIKLFQAALAKDADCAILYHLIAYAYASLGETETAAQMWDAASARSQGWALPRALTARVRLSEGRFEEADARARSAIERSPLLEGWRVFLIARWNLISKAPRPEELAELITQSEKILAKSPNEPEILPLYIRLLARAGKRDVATEKLKSIASGSLPVETLLRLDEVARQEKLEVGDLMAGKAQESDGSNPALALRRALDLLHEGKPLEGRAFLEDTRKQAKSVDDPRWSVVLVTYLDAANDPAAGKSWAEIGEKFPRDLMVQTAALASSTRYNDREFWKRTIDRLRALTGDEGQLWRLEQSRMLLSGDPGAGDKSLSEAITRLTDLVRQSPGHAEAHRLLGLALARDNKLARAAEELSSALNLRPTDIDAALELIAVQRQAGNLKAARTSIDQLAQQPDLADEVKLRVAALYEDDGRADKAIMLLTARPPGMLTGTSITGSPATEALRNGRLARLYRRVGRTADADMLFLKLQDDPNAAAGDLAAGAEYLAQRGKQDQADAMIARLKKMNLRPAVMEAIEGRFAERFGTIEGAEKHFEAAIVAEPKAPEAWRELAGFLLRRGKLTEAATTIEQGLQAISSNAAEPPATSAGQITSTGPAAPPDAALKALQKAVATLRTMKQPRAAGPLIDMLVRDPSDAAANGMLKILADAQSTPATPESTAKLIARLQELSEANPDFLPAIEALAQSYLDTGNPEKAASVAAKAMQNFSYEAEPARLATAAYSIAGKWSNALDAATQWRQRTPSDPLPAELAIAAVMLGQKRPQQAAVELAPYVKANPLILTGAQPAGVDEDGRTPRQTRIALHAAYAKALILQGRVADAVGMLKPYLPKDTDVRQMWLELTSSHKTEAAATAWIAEVVPHLAADSVAEQFSLAMAWQSAGKTFGSAPCYDKAAEQLAPLVAAPKAGRDLWTLYAENAQERQDYDHAIDGWRNVIKSGPPEAYILNNLAYALLVRGTKSDLTEARQLSEQAIIAAPEQSTFHDTLARIHSKLGERDDAIKTFRVALSHDPNVEAMIGLADELSRGGTPKDKVEARTWLTKARKALDGAPPLSAPLKQQLEQLRAELDPAGR